MSTTPAPSLNTTEKIQAVAAITDAVLKPLSGADDSSAGAQGVAAGVDTAAEIAKVIDPKYAADIQLAASLEPVAYHAGYAIAHFLQHLFHHTVSQTAAPAAPVKA